MMGCSSLKQNIFWIFQRNLKCLIAIQPPLLSNLESSLLGNIPPRKQILLYIDKLLVAWFIQLILDQTFVLQSIWYLDLCRNLKKVIGWLSREFCDMFVEQCTMAYIKIISPKFICLALQIQIAVVILMIENIPKAIFFSLA